MSNISPSVPVNPQMVRLIQQQIAAALVEQIESDEDLSQYFELATFNPMTMAQRFRNLSQMKHLTRQMEETETVEEIKIFAPEEIDEAAARFQRNNFELNARTLKILRSRIRPGDTPEEVLAKVFEVYPDPSLADEALQFLLETADPQTKEIIRAARELLHSLRGKEVVAGRNMGVHAREFSEKGLGSPTSLRDLYRDLVINPRDPLVLFTELTEKFRYAKLKQVITFILHSLGSDLKSKGPSIAPGELKRMFDEIRSLQGILQVFRFFQTRMALIHREFSAYNLTMPMQLDFESLGKILIRLVAERFMNPEKIYQTAKLLGLSNKTIAQIIIFTQMRDGLKQIAPKYFRDARHRDELYKAFLTALEKLEEKEEEEEEEEEK